MDASGNVLSKSLIRTDQSIMARTLWILAFAAATAIGARVEIPHQPVPYTLQTMFVILSGAFLGARHGAMSQVVYLASGILGAPVFSMGGFGVGWLLGPTGGYLLAFPIAAAVVGYLVQVRQSLLWSFISMAAGTAIIFVCGTVQLYAVAFKNWSEAFTAGFLIFSWWDILKLSVAAMTYHEIAKRWPRLPN